MFVAIQLIIYWQTDALPSTNLLL